MSGAYRASAPQAMTHRFGLDDCSFRNDAGLCRRKWRPAVNGFGGVRDPRRAGRQFRWGQRPAPSRSTVSAGSETRAEQVDGFGGVRDPRRAAYPRRAGRRFRWGQRPAPSSFSMTSARNDRRCAGCGRSMGSKNRSGCPFRRIGRVRWRGCRWPGDLPPPRHSPIGCGPLSART